MSAGSRCALAAAFAGLATLAGAAADASAVVKHDFSLGARVTRTDNLYLDPKQELEGRRQPVEETIYAALPTFVLEWRERQDRLLLDLRSEYWSFSGDDDLDAMWVHDLSAELGWQRWAPFLLEARAARERVPSTQDREGESIVEQADRTRALVRTGLAWERGAGRRVELVYRGEIEDFSGGGDAKDDRVVKHFGEGVLRRQWDPRWSSELSARYGLVGQELADDYSELGLVAMVDYRLSERLAAKARLEWKREEVDVPESVGGDGGGADETREHSLLSAQIRRTLERAGFWSLRYEKRLEGQPDGDTLQLGRASAEALLQARLGSEIGGKLWHETREFRVSGRDETDWGPLLLARWVIAPPVALDVGGSWVDTTIRKPGEEEIEDRTLRAAVALVVLLGRHFAAEAGYAYRDNDSTDADRPYTANLFYAAVTYHLGTLPAGKMPPSNVGRLTSMAEDLPAGR